MKEIKFDGVEVKDKLLVNIVDGEEAKVSRISNEGMLFETTTKLNINSSFKFRVVFGDQEAVIEAKVLNILWKSSVEKHKSTLYQVIAEFEHLEKSGKAVLDLIIGKILDDVIPSLHDSVQGAKFGIKE